MSLLTGKLDIMSAAREAAQASFAEQREEIARLNATVIEQREALQVRLLAVFH